MTHAFYAGMGGFLLEGHGVETPFPVDAAQLLFLVEQGYVEYPEITRDDIGDRNKSDGFARWVLILIFIRVNALLLLMTMLQIYRSVSGGLVAPQLHPARSPGSCFDNAGAYYYLLCHRLLRNIVLLVLQTARYNQYDYRNSCGRYQKYPEKSKPTPLLQEKMH
jgi:hypothetical protein